jgi:hypothetical protein
MLPFFYPQEHLMHSISEPPTGDDLESRLQAAFEEAIGRKEGTRNPKGGYTHPGLWEPAADERRPCCDEVADPRPGWGWSLKRHCETTKHIAQLFGVPEGALARRVTTYIRERNRSRKQGGPTILFDQSSQPRVAAGIALQQVDRLLGKLERELNEQRRLFRGGLYGEMRAPDTSEIDHWLRQLK